MMQNRLGKSVFLSVVVVDLRKVNVEDDLQPLITNILRIHFVCLALYTDLFYLFWLDGLACLLHKKDLSSQNTFLLIGKMSIASKLLTVLNRMKDL